MPLIKIQPLDTLFFRDGKPFTMGEDTYATSQKLPNASVFWGALFTDLLYRELVTINDTPKLKIKGVYLYDSEKKNLLMPTPLDLFQNKDKKVVADKFELVENSRFGNDKMLHGRIEGAVLAQDSHVSLPEDTFITSAAFWNNYLSVVQINNIDLQKTDFIKSYPKIGIGRNKGTRTVSEGQLYRVNMQEYASDWSFIVDISFDENTFPKSGIIRLGGEGKIAQYQIIQDELIKTLKEKIELQKNALIDSEFFKLYFASPLIYKMDIDTLFNVGDIQLVSVVTGKSIEIGGFDYKERKPKPMLKAYPSGSVFICHKPKGKNLKDFEIHLTKQLEEHGLYGFNQFFFTKY